ncbi:MAG: 50S ribosomal protein L9 [Thermodesulfobacteriota bacterium]
MRVILTETIDELGIVGKEMNVADGFARNYLLPKKLAVPATEANRKALERKRIKYEEKIAKEKALAKEVAARLDGTQVTIAAKVADEEKLYGSVGVREIADALAQKGFEIPKTAIRLGEPIKFLGEYEVRVRLFAEVRANIVVNVVAEEAQQQ